MLPINSVILFETNQGKRYERILYYYKDIIYLIDIYGNSMPTTVSESFIQNGLNEGTIFVLENEPYMIIKDEEDILPKHKAIRDKAYDAIKEIVIFEPDIYIADKRVKLVREYVDNIHEATIMRYLKRFWQRGMHKNSLLPDYYKCGKVQGDKVINNTFTITPETIRIFNAALNRFYYNSSQKTLTLTYELMIKEYFSENGIVNDDIPTLRQFRYWFNKERNIKKEVSTRQSAKRYELQHRGLTGSATEEAFGPGAIFQIDATVGDVYLVSQYNRNWIIGRPVIYTVMDVFSRCVVGINISLEGPSWIGASIALINAATDKVSFCRKYDIEINNDEWNYCSTLPEAIIADRGELEGQNIESLITAFGIKILNTSPYRGDMKGIIERYFDTLNQHTKPLMPGTIKSQYRERGEQDYRLSATLDLKQFTQIIIKCVLYHNNHHYLKNYTRSEDMIADGVEPIPKLIWEWGIANRTGRLRTVDEDLLKLNLLPNDKATVTGHGIKFKGMLFGSKISVKERWFEKARNNGAWKVDISYDPRDMSYIYIKHEDGRTFDKCFLLEHQSRYKEKSIEEITYLLEYEKMQAKASKKVELQNKINLIDDIEKIIEQAKDDTKNEVEEGISKKRRIQNIRDNRNFEKQQERKQNIIEIRPEEPKIVVEEKSYGDTEQDMVELLLKAQKEGKDRAGFDT
ncbi:MAG: Mu transposase C-terminal domain-containing protein [Clostridium botulinum]|uniref:Mu transposase C-terminal domain-containing protein n=1 Tax=uncultured Clostridium sp. TaxID=59620 RepID=UPI00280AB284|nr:Mu transposase C-terminal domain-containing protein [uncultured Clostridium sp.]MDU6878933.1 Mu transposase C-terminal domain-containing protein [Clostridium botulinum]